MKKKYVYASIIIVLILLISLFFLFVQYSRTYYGCTQAGCMSRVTLIIDNQIFLEEGYKHELEINNEKYILYETNYDIAFINIYEGKTFINLNNYFTEQLEKTNQLKSLNIDFFELSTEGEILSKYSVKNYELIAQKYYPNGERCEPFCYNAEPIYLILE